MAEQNERIQMEQHRSGLRYIGVDGGGTKTTCVIGDTDGVILAESRGESSSTKSRPWEEVQRVLLEGIRAVLERSGTDVSQLGGIFLGLAGSDRPQERKRIVDWLQTELPASVRITVHNDAVTALAAGTWGQKGIALISGTGSIAYGYEPATDTFVRVGGWGYLLGDEGSGFDLGRQALVAVMRAHDGRGEQTDLTKLLLDKWALAPGQLEQLIPAVYGQENIRTAIADGSKLVIQAAEAGDPVSLRLLEEAAGQLEQLVSTAAARMGIRLSTESSGSPLAAAVAPLSAAERPVPLVLTGGVFSSGTFYRLFQGTAAIQSGAFELRLLERPPVIGAYVLALQENGIIITKEMQQHIEAFVPNGR
jgi:N-acetylglucosamine kinase-like BadF-type ATPase